MGTFSKYFLLTHRNAQGGESLKELLRCLLCLFKEGGKERKKEGREREREREEQPGNEK
jgi:hypothetical protein